MTSKSFIGNTIFAGSGRLVTVALPAAVPATMLAGRYRVYESEAASTLILTSFLMIGRM
jgi:predicted permease